MKKLQWLTALLLCAAAVTAFTAAGFAEAVIPEPAEPEKKEYQLLIGITGPAEVTITHPGETPEAEPVVDVSPDEYVPDGIYRLKEGPDYRVEMKGTGEGTLTYTVTLKDPSGEEEDRELHRFENIAVTEKTKISSVATGRRQVTLLADTDGDGKTDTAYGAGQNSVNFTVTYQTVMLGGILFLVIVAIVLFKGKKKTTIIQKPILDRKG